MSLTKLFIVFSFIYTFLLYIAGFVIVHYGFENNTGINTGILIGTIIYLYDGFSKKNKKISSTTEKKKVIIGFSLINIFIQLLLSLFSIWAEGSNINIFDLFFAVIIVGGTHTILIYFIIINEKDKGALEKSR